MKVAFVHYWLTGMRGGERVLEAFSRMFPDADIFTHVVDRDNISQRLAKHEIRTTYISKFPFVKKHYQKYLGFMPRALEELDLSAYDLVISSESGPAKGVITRPDAFHLCYCHSPMRYIWDMYPDYLEESGWLARQVFPHVAHRLRTWDVASSARVDQFVANSSFVRQRINKYYRRDAEVVFPPVNVARFAPDSDVEKGDFFLAAGELVGYKRFDLAVEACKKANAKLIVVGSGSELPRLQAMAGPNTTFMNRVDFATLRNMFASCRALIFPGLEDFGMVPVEVMASGRPVIAYGKGGALDSVAPGLSGQLVSEQTVEAFSEAISNFDDNAYSPEAIIQYAGRFSTAEFERKIQEILRGEGLTAPGVGLRSVAQA